MKKLNEKTQVMINKLKEGLQMRGFKTSDEYFNFIGQWVEIHGGVEVVKASCQFRENNLSGQRKLVEAILVFETFNYDSLFQVKIQK